MQRLIKAIEKYLAFGIFSKPDLHKETVFEEDDDHARDMAEQELILALAESKTQQLVTLTRLRSNKIYWGPEDENIQRIMKTIDGVGVEQLSEKDKLYLIKELDRRLIQFWDKVDYENKLPNRGDLYKKIYK